jgi:two-component system sensor histidine kinase YesM
MRRELWRKSIFKRLIVSFILILLPIYILSIVIYDLGIDTLSKEISNSMISQLDFYQDSLEKDVRRIRTLEFDLVNDKDINRLASIPQSLDNIRRMEGILRIQQRLDAVKNSSIYISDIFVMIPAISKHISATSVSEFDRDLYDKMKNVDSQPDKQVIDGDGDIFMNVQYPYAYMTRKREKLFIIAIKLSKERLKETLQSMTSNSNEGVFFVDIEKQSFIAAKDTELNQQIYGLITPEVSRKAKNAEVVVVNKSRYLAVYMKSDFFDSILCKYVPESSVFHDLEKYSRWFILLTAAALVIIVVYSIYMYNFIHKPLSRLASSFKSVEKGAFDINIEHRHDDEFRYIYHRFNAMVENIKMLIDQVYRQKILVQKAEMKQLQSQINPHFLYNSFFILNTMARVGDYENLERFTEQLGMYFQFVTRSAADEVPIQNEVNHARIYTEIQAMRFSNWIRVSFDELPESFHGLIVPRLILQPIIENAFEHGLTMESGQGILLVKFEKRENEYRIIVEDNGNKMSDAMLDRMQSSLESCEDHGEVTALQNIHQRIQLKFGSQSGLSVGRGSLGGFKAAISIASEKEDPNVQAADCR